MRAAVGIARNQIVQRVRREMGDIATLAVAVEPRLQPAAMALLGFLGEVR
jgi:hypothetical protein